MALTSDTHTLYLKDGLPSWIHERLTKYRPRRETSVTWVHFVVTACVFHRWRCGGSQTVGLGGSRIKAIDRYG